MPQTAKPSKTTILLADDHRDFAETVAGLLGRDFEVVGNVSDGRALVKACLELKPDVVVTDISMPGLNGIEAAEQLSKLGSLSKVVFLTIHADADFVRACLGIGAMGYVVKSHMTSELVPAIQDALAGHIYVSHRTSREQ